MEKKKKKKKKKKKNNNKTIITNIDSESRFSLFEVIIIILISVIFGVIIGYLLTYGNSNLSRVRSNTNLGEIVSTYNNIVDNYYDDLDEDKLAESAIKGMISSLEDPYSSFLDAGSTDSFNESVDGEYTGIGISVEYNGEYNQITKVLKGGPAEKEGLKVGDVILEIDNKSCRELYPEEMTKLLSGKVGSKVSIKVLRGEEELSYTLKIAVIEIENVVGRVIDKKIGYIQIKMFSSNSYDQFITVLNKLEKKNVNSIIIDVRDNPGGHLAQAQKILDVFFNKKTVLYQIENNGSRKKIYASDNKMKSIPVVILINGETASSAEVVTACFQDNYKNATVVGSKSYGKGNVQKSLTLTNGTSIRFTIEKWFTPKGKSVSDVGIIPDVVVEQNPEYYVNYLEEDDSQLAEAIGILKKSH